MLLVTLFHGVGRGREKARKSTKKNSPKDKIINDNHRHGGPLHGYRRVRETDHDDKDEHTYRQDDGRPDHDLTPADAFDRRWKEIGPRGEPGVHDGRE